MRARSPTLRKTFNTTLNGGGSEWLHLFPTRQFPHLRIDSQRSLPSSCVLAYLALLVYETYEGAIYQPDRNRSVENSASVSPASPRKNMNYCELVRRASSVTIVRFGVVDPSRRHPRGSVLACPITRISNNRGAECSLDCTVARVMLICGVL